MLARAKADTSDPAIEYRLADLEKLALPEEAFDLVYSALAFHYVEDFGRLVTTVHRSLVPGAHFVFTIEHPIYMAAAHPRRSEEHTSELQSLMRISYAVFCLKNKKTNKESYLSTHIQLHAHITNITK